MTAHPAFDQDEFKRRFGDEWDGDRPHADQRPVIRVVQGELDEIVAQAHELLAEQSEQLFRYGNTLSYVARVTRTLTHKDGRTVPEGTLELVTAAKEWIQLELCRLAHWQRPMVRKDGSEEWIPCDPPMKVATAVLADRGNWRSRVLTGLAETPVLRADGSVCDKPGYDDATGIFYEPNGRSFPPIPRCPTRDDALDALQRLEDPLKEFPFVADCHKSAALAMILTAVIRRQLKAAPAFGLNAREAGTGKNLLANVACIIATGRASPITPYTEDEAEQRKRITASLLAGALIVNIDNVTAPVDSQALAALLTSETWDDRILGVSRNAGVPSNALVVLTGNNLLIQGDMTRRVIPVDLDAQCERPELREFGRDLVPWLHENRGQLVTDALTVLAAWRRAGRPLPLGFRTLGSYENWSREVAACLVWLDREDPMQGMEQIRTADPRRALLRRILANWYGLFGDSEQTVGAVMQHVEPHPDERVEAAELREAIAEITADARNDQARKVRLGIYLRTNAGRVVTADRDGHDSLSLRLAQGSTLRRAVRWSATCV